MCPSLLQLYLWGRIRKLNTTWSKTTRRPDLGQRDHLNLPRFSHIQNEEEGYPLTFPSKEFPRTGTSRHTRVSVPTDRRPSFTKHTSISTFIQESNNRMYFTKHGKRIPMVVVGTLFRYRRVWGPCILERRKKPRWRHTSPRPEEPQGCNQTRLGLSGYLFPHLIPTWVQVIQCAVTRITYTVRLCLCGKLLISHLTDYSLVFGRFSFRLLLLFLHLKL